jgi:hypothetical protein
MIFLGKAKDEKLTLDEIEITQAKWMSIAELRPILVRRLFFKN